MSQSATISKPMPKSEGTTYKILFIIGLCHLLNDSIQSVIPAMFPILEKSMGLSFTELGIIAFALNIVSSFMQPIIGFATDKKPFPYALPIGLSITLIGVAGLAFAPSYKLVVISVLFIGLGSAIFHPEGSRVAYMAAGPRRGLAQSIYQVGGNSGQALAPLITAVILVPLGQRGAAWFTIVAAIAVGLLFYIAAWYSRKLQADHAALKKGKKMVQDMPIPKGAWIALSLILFLIFARTWYISGMTSFYAFYAIKTYHFSITQSQIYLFIFLAAGALGTFFGGPLADKFGKKNLILFSLLASAPFSILLPFVPASAALFLLAISGFILMLSFSVTVVYAQELIPGKVGTMAGLTVGFAFGMGAIGSVALGFLADLIGLNMMLILTGFLPLLGLSALYLPSDSKLAARQIK